MNIGIVTTWFERGASYVSRAYLESLIRHGNKVFIYARGGETYAKGNPFWDKHYVTWAPRYNPISKISEYDGNFINPLHIEKWLYSNKIDIVIFNEEHGIECVSKVSNLGYIVGAYIDYYKKDTINQFAIYDFLLCNTRRHFGVFKNHPKAIFIQWGTNTTLFSPSRNQGSNNRDNSVVFFHSAGMGGINNRKGTDLTVKAFQNTKGDAKLIIHSQVEKSKYGNDIELLIENDDRIEFIEKTVGAPGLYHLGDVFVYPTRLEGIGLCIPEALSSGLPVITTNCPPMSEFITDNYNGMLVDVVKEQMRFDNYYWPECVVDLNSLTKKMQFYIDNKNILIEHQKKARESAKVKFCWQKNSIELGPLLNRIKIEKESEIRRFSVLEALKNSAVVGNIRFQTLLKKYFHKAVNE
jgi:1,2-diacylglycerol 3-alpha-glucosyltransferase